MGSSLKSRVTAGASSEGWKREGELHCESLREKDGLTREDEQKAPANEMGESRCGWNYESGHNLRGQDGGACTVASL